MKIKSRISGLAGLVRASRLGRRHVSVALWVAMATVLTTACSDDSKQPAPQADGHTAVIYLNFKTAAAKPYSGMQASQKPGMSVTELWMDADTADSAPTEEKTTAGTTRAPMTRAVDETGIQTVDVLSFKTDPADPTDIKKGTFFYRSRGVYTQITPGQGRVEVKLMGSPEAQTLVVLANARTQVDALGAVYGEQKEAVMSRLTFDVAMEVSPDLTNGIPMWGELPNEVVGEGFSPSGAPKEVTMIRSVAKFTLVNPPQSDPKGFFFYYDQLRLYNYRKKGRIAPDNYNRTDSKVNAPTVPAGARPPRGTFVQLNSEVSPGRIGIYEGKQKSFYLCEVDNNVHPSGGNALDDLCLIVYVKSHGTGFIPPKPQRHGYYRLDFKDYGTGVRMDILRNHEYKIQVESVEGLPADTPEEAFKGNHTLKCRIVPWNEVQEEVKVPGNKRLTVDQRSITLTDQNIAIGKALTITTENTGGWQIDPLTVPAWATITGDLNSTTDGTSTITIKTKEANKFQSAKLKLTAGGAEMGIWIQQRGKLPIEYVAEHNIAGGFGSLRWANNDNNSDSGLYSNYDATGISNYAPPNNICANVFNEPLLKDQYHLPTTEEWTCVFTYSSAGAFFQRPAPTSTLNVNEACEIYATNPTHKRTYASDYYTRGNDGITYALRFKKGTGAPDNDDNDHSLTTHPLASNDDLLCAYRYERVGSWTLNSSTSRVIVTVRYVGPGFAGNINTISNEAWWNNNKKEDIQRIFPICGRKEYQSDNIRDRGVRADYWAGGRFVVRWGLINAWGPNIREDALYTHVLHKRENMLSIRPFSNN
ncbi:hypothetical protein [Bacteroides pyogenes]|nr:hypothetical protein [Bacteroides pyogenes]SUV34867.1 putative lipoprotein [Bacteroides pyogenes]